MHLLVILSLFSAKGYGTETGTDFLSLFNTCTKTDTVLNSIWPDPKNLLSTCITLTYINFVELGGGVDDTLV